VSSYGVADPCLPDMSAVFGEKMSSCINLVRCAADELSKFLPPAFLDCLPAPPEAERLRLPMLVFFADMAIFAGYLPRNRDDKTLVRSWL
jgi:hypothetical protein